VEGGREKERKEKGEGERRNVMGEKAGREYSRTIIVKRTNRAARGRKNMRARVKILCSPHKIHGPSTVRD
jgi:hypothetical protein